jgi:hypothetical protein
MVDKEKLKWKDVYVVKNIIAILKEFQYVLIVLVS